MERKKISSKRNELFDMKNFNLLNRSMNQTSWKGNVSVQLQNNLPLMMKKNKDKDFKKITNGKKINSDLIGKRCCLVNRYTSKLLRYMYTYIQFLSSLFLQYINFHPESWSRINWSTFNVYNWRQTHKTP